MTIRTIPGGVTMDVLVQPRASRARFGPSHGDRIKVFVTSPPVDGAANRAVVALVAKQFACARRNVEVISGQSSRRKTVRVLGIDSAAVKKALS